MDCFFHFRGLFYLPPRERVDSRTTFRRAHESALFKGLARLDARRRRTDVHGVLSSASCVEYCVVRGAVVDTPLAPAPGAAHK